MVLELESERKHPSTPSEPLMLSSCAGFWHRGMVLRSWLWELLASSFKRGDGIGQPHCRLLKEKALGRSNRSRKSSCSYPQLATLETSGSLLLGEIQVILS